MSENVGSVASGILINILRRNQENFVMNDGDYKDENDGLVHCGKCKEAKQFEYVFPIFVDKDGNPENGGGEKILMWTPCACEREIEERKKAEEQKQKDMIRIAELKKLSLLDKRYEEAVFDNFISNSYNEKNLRLCKRFAEHFDDMRQKNQGLLMWGNVGTGKSFAAACIVNYLLSTKTPCVMTSIAKILQLIQNNNSEENDIMSRLSRVPLVVFDDFGTERNTDYALEKIYNILDSRYRSGLPMIVTTNLTFKEMQNETDIRYSRLYDRIFECCYPMQFTGDSFRKKAAYDKFNAMEKFLNGE